MVPPYSSTEVAMAMGISLDTFYRTRQIRHERDGLPAPISERGPLKWERTGFDAWLTRHHPMRPKAIANDTYAPPSMADPKFPYVIAWRLRQGTRLVDADLRHPLNDENGCPVGAWFNLQEASDFSDKRRSEIEAARRAGKLPKKTTVRKRATIEDLLDDWSKSAEYTALSAAPQSSYRKCISAILYRPQTREAAAKMRAEIRTAKLLGVAEPAREFEAIATATPSSIGNPELRAFYNYARSLSRRLRTQPHAAHAWPPHRRGRRVAVCGSRRRLQPTSCGRGLLQAGRIVRRPRGHGPLL
jgi:hypothetical protein